MFAGTTDKIFEFKYDVYDAFVDNQNVILREHMAPIGKVNTADKKRYHHLCAYKYVYTVFAFISTCHAREIQLDKRYHS